MEKSSKGIIKVLVVDDEERFRKTTVRMLKDKGLVVDDAADGAIALEKLAEGDFDVVLLDIKMPGLSGEETFHRIQQNSFDVETVFLSGHVSLNRAVDLIQHGAFDYILKPASFQDIFKKIQKAYDQKMLRNGKIDIHDLLSNPE
ncbi:Response regulator receiver domain-containing protein [Maridesulfovibrio ferrireducens]|uniref:Response regulator receiver domain-containing protein n=1 Tax=Maridesulfovibrio ferrireducens TaxID=246191 RepID=A0A1G9L7U6_9BACT|nr:response regulator [Maridesulfovibrio ferrireducens]SDL57876.1 Response regulator receiver domain-containing protein [Maridesulfovibrio ferrireducens]